MKYDFTNELYMYHLNRRKPQSYTNTENKEGNNPSSFNETAFF